MSNFHSEIFELQRASHAEQAATARAELEIAQARGDVASGAEAAQRLLVIEKSWNDFHDGARRHAAALNPPPERSDAWQTKPLDEMTDNDVFRMMNQTSKYADVRAGGEPLDANEYRQHMAERDRRVASGHYGQGKVGR